MAVELHQPRVAVSHLPQRIERKFYVAPARVMVAYGLLRQVCRVDPQYPAGRVSSVYFDTADLEQHRQSVSGDLRRDKVRIRWYGDGNGDADTRTVYLELKSKRGLLGSKLRARLGVTADALAAANLARGIIPRPLLDGTLASFGHFPHASLWPVIAITYQRYRFIDPFTGQRVSLDCRIRSTALTPAIGHGETELELPGAVIEIKGSSTEVPVSLRALGVLEVDWSRFSKYSSCIEAHQEKAGSVGRLSPSGRIV